MKVQETAKQLMQEWLDAAATGNIGWFEENLLPQFCYLNAGGGRLDKSGIKALNAITETSYVLHAVEVQHISDNVFLAIGQYTGKGHIPKEATVSDDMRNRYVEGVKLQYSQVWIEYGGKWRCLMLQTTPIT
jgi:hypothetical protein